MAINQLTFAGTTLPCTVQKFPTIMKPSRKYEAFSIPGRSGDLFIYQNAYNNVLQAYEVYAGDGTPGNAPSSWGTLAAALYKDGYQRLQDTYDVDHYRLAIFLDAITAENSQNRHGSAVLTFNCRPERFLLSGDDVTTITTASGSITNPTAFDAKPLIKVTGTAPGSITIGGVTMTINALADYVYIDCDTMDAYRQPAENKNNTISGSFPVLHAGANAVTRTGGVTKIEITPRWWEL